MQKLLSSFLASKYFRHRDASTLATFVSAFSSISVSSDAADLLKRASEHLLNGSFDEALTLLLYLQRRAPSNRLVTLFIGDLRSILRHPNAGEAFKFVATYSDWSGAWYRLSHWRFRDNDFLLAASDLHETLSRNAPFSDADGSLLASEIANASESLGWCGVNNQGTLAVGGKAATFRSKDLEIRLDGKIVNVKQSSYDKDISLRLWQMPDGWTESTVLNVFAKGVPLIGSPIKIASIIRSEGFVSADEDGIKGWAWLPGEPESNPSILVENLDNVTEIKRLVARNIESSEANIAKLSWPKSFTVSLNELPNGRLRIRGPHGRVLYGSPLNPWGTIRSGIISTRRVAERFPALNSDFVQIDDFASEIPVPAKHFGYRDFKNDVDLLRTCLIVIPVYRGYETTLDCVHSVLEHKGENEKILVISDASPDKKLIDKLKQLAKSESIHLMLEEHNKGFPGTVNIGMRAAASALNDVILLNSDTIVSAGWVEKLRQAAYLEPSIGTATPLSNAATIMSYPYHDKINSIPTPEEVAEFSSIAHEVNPGLVVDIPTAHGFCMFIKYECLVDTGVFRDETFGQGYGEENDFSMRARHLGWRNVAVPGLYIGHIEGQSFASAKEHLVARNLEILNRLHPGYDQVIAEWQKKEPLAQFRRRIDIRRLCTFLEGRNVICYVSHDREGGVLRHVQARAQDAELKGFATLICRPSTDSEKNQYCVITCPSLEVPNLRFCVDTELEELRAFLLICHIDDVEVHHFIGHHYAVMDLVCSVAPSYDVHIHDYSWFCPRITLTTLENRYCGEPALEGCVQCIKESGSNLGVNISPPELIERSGNLFSNARRIIAPTEDTAKRFRSRFNIAPLVTPWEEDNKFIPLHPIAARKENAMLKVCIAGAIGYEKGYDIILGCAKLAAEKSLPIEFVVVGFTCDDARLLKTGKVKITGRFAESEAVKLIKEQHADVGFLPALWPETWSYVLSQMWEARLPVVAFDIGAPQERITKRDGGYILPFGLPVERIVQWFLSLTPVSKNSGDRPRQLSLGPAAA